MAEQERKEWLAGLRVGDDVTITRLGSTMREAFVVRVDQHCFVLSNVSFPDIYDRSTGVSTADSRYKIEPHEVHQRHHQEAGIAERIGQATPEQLAAIERILGIANDNT